jgi:hypothetical protein
MIDQGLLWLDDSKRQFADKVIFAAQRYQQKFGQAATICYVHPSMLDGGKSVIVGGIAVLPLKTVAPQNFWLGVDDGKKRRVARIEKALDKYFGDETK